jgi:hypothetical protein
MNSSNSSLYVSLNGFILTVTAQVAQRLKMQRRESTAAEKTDSLFKSMLIFAMVHQISRKYQLSQRRQLKNNIDQILIER